MAGIDPRLAREAEPMSKLHRLLIEDEGLEAVEYALLLGLVTVGTIAIIAAIGAFVTGRFQSLSDQSGID